MRFAFQRRFPVGKSDENGKTANLASYALQKSWNKKSLVIKKRLKNLNFFHLYVNKADCDAENYLVKFSAQSDIFRTFKETARALFKTKISMQIPYYKCKENLIYNMLVCRRDLQIASTWNCNSLSLFPPSVTLTLKCCCWGK